MDGNKKEFIELSEEELFQLPENEFMEYLDRKAAYLKGFTRPLGTYHTKQFMAQTVGGELSTEQLKKAKEIGAVGDEAWTEGIRKATEKMGGDPKLSDPGIKNIKTNRKQWFD
jgi:hypothetical protein